MVIRYIGIFYSVKLKLNYEHWAAERPLLYRFNRGAFADLTESVDDGPGFQ